MKRLNRIYIRIGIILCFGLIPSVLCQFFTKEPVKKAIHVTSFRYGKDPSVIRCNRGDTLLLTFSSNDTGHSFYLEEFDVDAKVSPSAEEVLVFKISDPTFAPVSTRQIELVARHPGILNYIVSRSNYRCHVWCGPMHAFEQGKLVIFPNTLLFFSFGCIGGILFLWITGFRGIEVIGETKDILAGKGFLKKLIKSRWPQTLLTIFALLMIYVVILTATLGTKVSGRNLGVLLMWAIWLFILVAFLTPIFGRLWCTICPLPSIGDWIQRKSFFTPVKGKTGDYNNKFSGLFLKWPGILSNDWPRLIVFMILATFSATLVATPKVSGITVLMLLVVPTLMAPIWELRAFCRYICPVSVFIGPYSRMSFLALRNKSQETCNRCKPHYCQKGSLGGWACPYGLNVRDLTENSDCGLCLECTRSCLYENVSVYKRPFASETGTGSTGQAWLSIAIFTLGIVYSILYLGQWPQVRDYVNILDKGNWDLFSIYSVIVWTLALGIVPGILYLMTLLGIRLSGTGESAKSFFLSAAGSLLPIGLMLWIAFVIPMLFVNVTFILQSLSDPFGWGWDFLGTANTPWHQLLPRFIPVLQAASVLTGTYLSLRNLKRGASHMHPGKKQVLLLLLPVVVFISIIAVSMLLFFTN